MGLQVSKPVDKKIGRTKSNVDQKSGLSDEIIDFSSNLNSLSSLQQTTNDKLDYIVFQKMPFVGKYNALPFCSKISCNYDSVFICYDCSLNDQAYLCEGCFEKGNHDGHRFSVFPNNANWNQRFCRCGDYDFMKKNTICETHKQIKKIQNPNTDAKQKKLFTTYLNQILKTLFSLKDKNRQSILLQSLYSYLQKLTENNLYYSKILCQFLLDKCCIDQQRSNLRKILQSIVIDRSNYFRNLSFASQYKFQILRELIIGVNQNPDNANNLSQLIINFAGKIDQLNELAKKENLVLGINNEQDIKRGKFTVFYQKIISSQLNAIQIWKCIVRNKLIPHFITNEGLMNAIIKSISSENDKNKEQIIVSLLEQLLGCNLKQSQNYVIACLMILNPECFIIIKSQKFKGFDKKTQNLFINYYKKILSYLNTHQRYQQNYQRMFLLLPFFTFGQTIINKFWEQLDRRVNILQKNKQKSIIKQGSMNYFEFIATLLSSFLQWEHNTIQVANQYKFKYYVQNKTLIQKLLQQNFSKNKKIFRQDLLKTIDTYTQGDRGLSSDAVKKYVRFNPKKGKYYYIGQNLANNIYNYEELNVGMPFKLTQWHQLIREKIFTQNLYKIVPKIIKIAQRGLMQDLQMVKVVSNLSIGLSLLNKNYKNQLKTTTRKFIKEIPDVKQDVYYVLAAIRDRFQLDVDDAEEKGMKGNKKIKLDLITQIRDKKYKIMKQKQQKAMKAWMKQANQSMILEDQQELSQDACHICKQKDSQNNRLVYPCNFTRNNIVSTLLKSQVTDLDINICLHKIHESCYQKITIKRQCPVCKFKVNCYVPQRPLADESYTKTWLKNFENIVTSINFQSGKSFNSDWATIFLTYLVFSRSFKVLLKNTEIQDKQRIALDQTLMLHYKNQLYRWPQLTNQAISRAQKTVKGQVRRQSNIKKAVKSLSLDMVIQQITSQPFKNEKRIEKKVRQMINFVGVENSQKIISCFAWCKDNELIERIFDNNISQQAQQQELFKIRQLPSTAKQYLQTTSIKCPMCGKYQPSTWQCLFCQKISCQNCINTRFHSQRDHRGSCIFLHLNNAEYELLHQNKLIEKDSLYRNQFQEGWRRNLKPQGWEASTKEIYKFFNSILHSQNVVKDTTFDSGNRFGGFNNHQNRRFGGIQTQPFGFGNYNNNFGGFGQINNANRFSQPLQSAQQQEEQVNEDYDQ